MKRLLIAITLATVAATSLATVTEQTLPKVSRNNPVAGDWIGQAEITATGLANEDLGFDYGDLSVTFEDKGRFMATAETTGCSINGVLSPFGHLSYKASATVSNCHNPLFNGDLGGQFFIGSDGMGRLELSAMVMRFNQAADESIATTGHAHNSIGIKANIAAR